MKIKTYIKKCNNKQLAQFLASGYFCDLNLDIALSGGNTIEKQAEYIYNNVFEREIPDNIFIIMFLKEKYQISYNLIIQHL